MYNEEYPGWLYEVDLGATTVWERWNSMEPDGSVSSTGMNSFNHYAYGSVGEWIWKTMGGIAPSEDMPGFRKAVISPVPDCRTGSVRAEYASAAGTWRIAWEVIDKDHAKMELSVPFNCTAEVRLPWAKTAGDREKTLTAGEYTWEVESAVPFRTMLSADDTMQTLLEDPKSKKVLMRHFPGIESTPWEMWGKSFRGMARELNDAKLLESVSAIDAELRAIV